ncbi:MAG: dephospho-CoA kinase [Thermodesulfobacteriota bacterium]
MIIGLTGGIASGKDTVAAFLKELGAIIIDADEISREIVKPGMSAWEELVEEFGRNILAGDNTIDRTKLGSIVFNEPAHLQRLNGITHPKIIAEEKKRVQQIQKSDPRAMIVVNAALLIESGNYKNMDKVIVVYVNEKVQIERAAKRDHLSLTDIQKRINAQIPLDQKSKYADFLIDNNGTIKNTKEQVEKIYKVLTGSVTC